MSKQNAMNEDVEILEAKEVDLSDIKPEESSLFKGKDAEPKKDSDVEKFAS